MLHVPVTNIMVGVKIKKTLLVKADGRDVKPTLQGLYLPTSMEVEAATTAAMGVDYVDDVDDVDDVNDVVDVVVDVDVDDWEEEVD